MIMAIKKKTGEKVRLDRIEPAAIQKWLVSITQQTCWFTTTV